MTARQVIGKFSKDRASDAIPIPAESTPATSFPVGALRSWSGSAARLVLAAAWLVSTLAARGLADTPAATHRLWSGDAPGAVGSEEKDIPKLVLYLDARRPAGDPQAAVPVVVVCPGGGYGGLAFDHEGHQIARWYNAHGIAAVIVDYRHRGKGYGHPAPLLDAQRAIRTVRAKAVDWKVNSAQVGVMGFSAGGHLASTAGTHFDAGRADADDPVDRFSCRPDFMILCYPVIAFDKSFTHRGSQRNLLGESPDPELVKSLSNETQVTAECPPAFLFHTQEDEPVPVENSLVFYEALCRAKVPAELHVYQKGPHGVGLAANLPATSSWPDRCLQWLRLQGLAVLEPQ